MTKYPMILMALIALLAFLGQPVLADHMTPLYGVDTNSATAADDDAVTVDIKGENDAGEIITVAQIVVTKTDVSDGSEDATVSVYAVVAGTATEIWSIGSASDQGDFSYASGVASLDNDVVGTPEMADADHGDLTWASGSATLDDDVVGTAEMADADHGDITWASGVASLDSGVVGTAEMDTGLVSTSLSNVTDLDITIVNGVVTSITSN